MTTTTATAKLRFIPDNGTASVVVNATEISVMWVNAAGWKVQARSNGRTVVSQLHAHEHKAVEAYNLLVAENTPAVAPVTTAPTLAAAAKGTATKVSDPAHTALAVGHLLGHIERGGKPGQASITLLNSLAKRGLITRIHRMDGLRKVITGGVLTRAGQIRLAELTAADAAEAERAARIAAALAFDATPAATPVSA